MQIATLLPTLFMRLILDARSLFCLYQYRVKYVERAGKEAFAVILSALLFEFVLSVLATLVGVQEALSSGPGDRLAFMDWILFSWCLASWVEQRPLLMQIFGSSISSGGTALDSHVANADASNYNTKAFRYGTARSSKAVPPTYLSTKKGDRTPRRSDIGPSKFDFMTAVGDDPDDDLPLPGQVFLTVQTATQP
ncbi:hypothetical protein HDU96_010006 [Phlyctochytrium bullatum]|nr:hypothetical protein HDU96_010006 [Phlyctochytrium bullatum]